MKRTRTFRAITYCIAASFGVFSVSEPSFGAQAPAAVQNTAPELTIKVIEGEDGVNIIRTQSAVKPVVQVTDKNNLPVAGVAVLFLLPSSGPSATFAGGARTLTVITNSAGRAAVTSMNPVGSGAFNISVTATYQGQVATTTIAQTNYLTAAAAQAAGAATSAGTGAGGGLSTTAIIGIIAGAAAAAAGIALSKGGGNGTRTPTGTIGVGGAPTLEPPR